MKLKLADLLRLGFADYVVRELVEYVEETRFLRRVFGK